MVLMFSRGILLRGLAAVSCIFACVLAPAGLAAAAEPIAKIQGFLINADSMSRDSEKEIVELEGHVQVVSKNRHFEAQQIRIYLREAKIELNGNVRMSTPTAMIGGDRMVLDYETETGMIYNGFVQSGQVLFEGGMIQKTGPNEFFVLEADYTTCTNCPASWSFQGTSIRAELGGYAYIRNSILRVGSWPVLWLPYLVVPLKSDRQSGLLTPGFEQSTTGGLALSESYFWAISRSTDATLTIKNYEYRGFKGLANYRYVLDENSEGELDVGAITDRSVQSDSRFNNWRDLSKPASSLNRWFVKYAHYHELPNGWVQRAQVNNASDLQYPRDFPNETLNHGDAAMENRFSFTKNSDFQHFSVDSSYYINLLQGDPLGGNDDAVHRLPEIRYSQIPTRLGGSGFYYSMNLNFVNFARSGPGYDNLSTYIDSSGKSIRYISNTCNDPTKYGRDASCVRTDDGVYTSATDLIRTGQRLDFQPTVMYPFNVADALDVLPAVSYRETQYQFPVGDVRQNVRRYLRAEVSSRMRFHRIFGDLDDARSTRYKHEIRPEITYTTLPWIDHRSHPFFGFSPQTEAPTFESMALSDDDIPASGLQFDYLDRIYDRNLVTMSVVNTITKKSWVQGVPVYKQLALIKLSQSYDAWKDSRPDPNKQPWSDISSVVDLRLDHLSSYSLFNYYPYQKVTNNTSRITLNDNDGRFVQLGMVKQFQIKSGEPVDASTRVEDYTLAGGFVSPYLNLMGKLTYDSNYTDTSRRIKSSTYIAQFKPPGKCWLITLIVDQITGGGITSNLHFEFTFDGVPKPPLPPETLDAYGF